MVGWDDRNEKCFFCAYKPGHSCGSFIKVGNMIPPIHFCSHFKNRAFKDPQNARFKIPVPYILKKILQTLQINTVPTFQDVPVP